MTLPGTRFYYWLGCLLGLNTAAAAQTVYAPAAVTGYTADVIANGAGTVASSTTATVDRGIPTVRWCFANTTFVNPSGTRPTLALPANGLINSISTSGLTFQMAAADVNNSLRIDGAGSGTLTLVNPIPCSEVVTLATEGNGSTAPKIFTVTFTDGTTQTFPNVVVPDWFATSGATPAVIVGSRVSYADNSVDNQGSNPRLFEVHLPLLVANYSKSVRSVSVSKTSTDPVLNVMGVSLGANCLGAPVGGQAVASLASVCPGSPTTLSLTGATVAGGITYQWQASTNGGTTYTDIVGATAATYVARPTVNTQYRAVLTCTLQSTPSAPVAITVLPTTATVAYGTPSSFCQNGTQAVVTATPAGGTFSAPTGLVINATTGALNLGASAVGTYTVTYTPPTTGCALPTTTTVTVTAPPPAVLAYAVPPATASFCRGGTQAVVTATPAGGTFSVNSSGLIINFTTGTLNLGASAAGTYAVTYTPPAGVCAVAVTTSVTVTVPPVPTLAYAMASFCQTAGSTSPTTVSPAGGTFGGSAGLVINTTTGAVNLAQTPVGTYTVSYTSPGTCSATTTTPLTVAPTQTVALNFGGTTFCKAGNAPVAAAAPAGGTYASNRAGLLLNTNTGAIDLAGSDNGTYVVTYTSLGPCAGQATAQLTIIGNNPPKYVNVLTPNGDGMNDVLKFNIADVQDYSLQVYSRWGRKVYEGNNPSEGWSPTDNSGGTYYYLVQYTDCAGRPQKARSWVEVIK